MSDETKIPLPGSLQEIVGALLFASETPLTAGEIRESIRSLEMEEGDNAEIFGVYKSCTSREVDEAIKGVGKALEVARCGFSLVCTAGAYRIQSVPSCGRYVRAMLKMDRPSRLGRASLETLAIIAYRQPITKSEIEQIRGVDVTANIKTLMEMEIIRLVGKSELPGHPFLYGTTPFFLEHFGLANLQELNELDPTLQRSNPRLKAASYKRPGKTELEIAAEEAAKAEAAEAAQPEGESAEAAAEPSEPEVESAAAAVQEDDFFIDDTPDEFDDEDDNEFEDDEEE